MKIKLLAWSFIFLFLSFLLSSVDQILTANLFDNRVILS